MGTLRAIIQEQERKRLSRNCCDIDGSTFDDGRKVLLQREIFAIAVKNILESLVSGTGRIIQTAADYSSKIERNPIQLVGNSVLVLCFSQESNWIIPIH